MRMSDCKMRRNIAEIICGCYLLGSGLGLVSVRFRISVRMCTSAFYQLPDLILNSFFIETAYSSGF